MIIPVAPFPSEPVPARRAPAPRTARGSGRRWPRLLGRSLRFAARLVLEAVHVTLLTVGAATLAGIALIWWLAADPTHPTLALETVSGIAARHTGLLNAAAEATGLAGAVQRIERRRSRQIPPADAPRPVSGP